MPTEPVEHLLNRDRAKAEAINEYRQLVGTGHTSNSIEEIIMDFAAAYTLIHRGAVYIVKPEEIPDSLPLAAVFRHERHYPERGHKSGTRGTSKKS